MLNDNYFYLTIYIMTNSNNAIHRKKTHDKKIKTHRQYKKKHNINKKTRRAYKKIGTQILSRKNNRSGGNRMIKAALLAATALSSAAATTAQGSSTTPTTAYPIDHELLANSAEFRGLHHKLQQQPEQGEHAAQYQRFGVGHQWSHQQFDELFPKFAKNLHSSRLPEDQREYANEQVSTIRTSLEEKKSNIQTLNQQKMDYQQRIAQLDTHFKGFTQEQIKAGLEAGTIIPTPSRRVPERVYANAQDKEGRVVFKTLEGGYQLNTPEYLELIRDRNIANSQLSQERQSVDKLEQRKSNYLLYLRNGLSPKEAQKYDDEFKKHMNENNSMLEHATQECTQLESDIAKENETDKSHMTPDEIEASKQRLRELSEKLDEANLKRQQAAHNVLDGQKMIIEHQKDAKSRGDTATSKDLDSLLVETGSQKVLKLVQGWAGYNEYGMPTAKARATRAGVQLLEWAATNMLNIDPKSKFGQDIRSLSEVTNIAPGLVLDATTALGGFLATSATTCGLSVMSTFMSVGTTAPVSVPATAIACGKFAVGLSALTAGAHYRYKEHAEEGSLTLDIGSVLKVIHLEKQIEKLQSDYRVHNNSNDTEGAERIKQQLEDSIRNLEDIKKIQKQYANKMTDFNSQESQAGLFTPLQSLVDSLVTNMLDINYLNKHPDFLAAQVKTQTDRSIKIADKIRDTITELSGYKELTPEVITEITSMLQSEGKKGEELTQNDALLISLSTIREQLNELHVNVFETAIDTKSSKPFYSADGILTSGMNEDEAILKVIETSEIYTIFFGPVKPGDIKQRKANAYILGNPKIIELISAYMNRIEEKITADKEALFTSFKEFAEALEKEIKDRPANAAAAVKDSQRKEVQNFGEEIYDAITYAAVRAIKKTTAIISDTISELKPPQEIREATTYALNSLADKLSIIAPSTIAFNYLLIYGLLAIIINSYIVPYTKYKVDKLRGVAGGVWREEPSLLTAMHDNAVKYRWIPDNLHTRRQALKEMVSIVDENRGEDANKKLEKVGLKADTNHIRTLAQALINAQIEIIQTQEELRVSYDEYVKMKDEATRAMFLEKNTDWTNAKIKYDDALKQIERLLTGEDVGNVSQQMNTFRDKTEDKHTKALTFCQKVEITNKARKASPLQKGGSLEDDHPKLKPTIQFIKEATQSFNNMKRLFEDKQPEPVSKDMETIFNITIKKVIFYVQVIIYNSTKTLNLPKDLLSLIMVSDYMRDLLESIYLLMTDIIHEVIVLNNILKSDIKDTLYATIYQKIFTHLFFIMEHHNIVFDETNYSFTKGYHLINIPNSSDNSDWLNDFKETNIRIIENIGFSESQKSFDKAIEYLNIYNKLSGIDPPSLEDEPPPLEGGSSEKPDIAGLLKEAPSKFGGSTRPTSKGKKKYKNPKTPKKYKLNKQHFSNSKKKIKKHKNFFNTSLKKTKYNK
jgi:hypothetical protein